MPRGRRAAIVGAAADQEVPMLPRIRTNVAAAAGRWSARRRRLAIWGWLGFVLVAFVVGGTVGQRYLTVSEMGNGGSGRALRAYDKADFPEAAQEQVLVQGRGGVAA